MEKLTLSDAFTRITNAGEYPIEQRYAALRLLFEIDDFFQTVDFITIQMTPKGISMVVGHPGGTAMRMRPVNRKEFQVVYQVPMSAGNIQEKKHDVLFKLNDKEQMDELRELIHVRRFYSPQLGRV